MSVSKFLFKSLLKQSRRAKGTSGFTLLELLVAMILAVLVITPLLTLVLNLLDTDRQEQAKNSSQQEIQAAADYIAQDMQQAVYIYDATALNTDHKDNATSTNPSGIKNQIPPVVSAGAGDCDNTNTDCVPVLAFWKRKFLSRGDTVKDDNNTTVVISTIDDSSQGSDRFLYSLVVYYLIRDRNSTNSTWSPAARIGRFEITDGIPDPTNNKTHILNPSAGFKLFDTTPASTPLQQRMNFWTNSGVAFKQKVVPLIDYIDDTTLDKFPASVKTWPSQYVLPDNNAGNGGALVSNTPNLGCSSTDKTGLGAGGSQTSSRVPPDSIIPALLNTGSFYACVNPVNALGQSVAQIYLRGNVFARLNKDATSWKTNISGNLDQQLIYRPTASVRVAVRGLLSDK